MIVGVELAAPAGLAPADQVPAVRRLVETAVESGIDLVALPPQRWTGPPGALQPLPLLAALSPDGVMVATGPLLAAVLNPVDLAERIATVDHAVGGRLIVEVRATARQDEVAPFGVAADDVLERTVESIGLWRRLWTEDVVEHDGPFYRVPGARPTLRPPGDRVPPIALAVHDRGHVRTAHDLGVGVSIDAGTGPAEDLAAALSEGPGAAPTIVRRPTTVDELGSAMDPLPGCTHLVLRPPAGSVDATESFIREAARMVAHRRSSGE